MNTQQNIPPLQKIFLQTFYYNCCLLLGSVVNPELNYSGSSYDNLEFLIRSGSYTMYLSIFGEKNNL